MCHRGQSHPRSVWSSSSGAGSGGSAEAIVGFDGVDAEGRAQVPGRKDSGGRPLTVNEARPKTEGGRGGGGGGRGGYGGGGGGGGRRY